MKQWYELGCFLGEVYTRGYRSAAAEPGLLVVVRRLDLRVDWGPVPEIAGRSILGATGDPGPRQGSS